MNNNLKKRIMARIYFEYAKNTFLEYSDYFMFVLLMTTSFMLISIQDVLINIPKDNLLSTFNFFVYALRNTSWIIQVLIAGFFAKIAISGIKMTYKNINRDWIMAKFRY